jgi:hypothetical protein
MEIPWGISMSAGIKPTFLKLFNINPPNVFLAIV